MAHALPILFYAEITLATGRIGAKLNPRGTLASNRRRRVKLDRLGKKPSERPISHDRVDVQHATQADESLDRRA